MLPDVTATRLSAGLVRLCGTSINTLPLQSVLYVLLLCGQLHAGQHLTGALFSPSRHITYSFKLSCTACMPDRHARQARCFVGILEYHALSACNVRLVA